MATNDVLIPAHELDRLRQIEAAATDKKLHLLLERVRGMWQELEDAGGELTASVTLHPSRRGIEIVDRFFAATHPSTEPGGEKRGD